MRYEAEQWPGVAVYVSGTPEPETCPECDGAGLVDGKLLAVDCPRCGGTGEQEQTGWVYVTMVGDDRRHLVEFDTLTPISDDDYCHECGQLGCSHDGRSND